MHFKIPALVDPASVREEIQRVRTLTNNQIDMVLIIYVIYLSVYLFIYLFNGTFR